MIRFHGKERKKIAAMIGQLHELFDILLPERQAAAVVVPAPDLQLIKGRVRQHQATRQSECAAHLCRDSRRVCRSV